MKPDTDTTLDDETLSRMFKALAHPTRIRIIGHLKSIDQCICGDIVNLFPLSQSTISQHLKSLKDAGLIHGELEGPRTCYCLNKTVFETFKSAVARL